MRPLDHRRIDQMLGRTVIAVIAVLILGLIVVIARTVLGVEL